MIESAYLDRLLRKGLISGPVTYSDPGDDNRKLVRRIWEGIWNEGALNLCDEVFCSDYIGHLPMKQVRGHEELKQPIRTFRYVYPDLHLDIEDLFGEGNRVALRWVMCGTPLDEITGMSPGSTVEIMGISLIRVENHRIAEEWGGFDPLRLMQQIDAIEHFPN